MVGHCPGSSSDRCEPPLKRLKSTAVIVVEDCVDGRTAASSVPPLSTSHHVPLLSDSQLPEEYLWGDQHPHDCGCHICHLLFGNPEFDDAAWYALVKKQRRQLLAERGIAPSDDEEQDPADCSNEAQSSTP